MGQSVCTAFTAAELPVGESEFWQDIASTKAKSRDPNLRLSQSSQRSKIRRDDEEHENDMEMLDEESEEALFARVAHLASSGEDAPFARVAHLASSGPAMGPTSTVKTH